MKWHCWTTLVVAAWGVAGCVSPDSETASSLAVPAQFNAARARAPVADGWLVDFKNPTLKALVREALENNPDIRLTAARLKAATAGARIAGADP